MGQGLEQQAACNCCGERESTELTTEIIAYAQSQNKKLQRKRTKAKLRATLFSYQHQKSQQKGHLYDDDDDDDTKEESKQDKRYTVAITNAFSLDGVTSTINNVANRASKKAGDAIEYVTPYHITLGELTANDEYFGRCNDIANKIRANIITPTPVTHDDADHENNWEYIESMGKLCQQPLYECLENLVDSIKLFPEYKEDQQEPTEVIKAGLKKYKRAKEKVQTNYSGNWLRLVDVCRSSIVHNNFQELYYLLLILARYRDNCFGFEIIKIKNRYQKPTDQGWADVTLLIKPVKINQTVVYGGKMIDLECDVDEEKVVESLDMGYNKKEQSDLPENDNEDGAESYEYDITAVEGINGPAVSTVGNGNIDEAADAELPGHICEVQLIHRDMWNKRKEGLFGHKAYNVTRTADSEAIKAAKMMGGTYGMEFMSKAIDMRGDVAGQVGAMAITQNREKIYEHYGSSSDEE